MYTSIKICVGRALTKCNRSWAADKMLQCMARKVPDQAHVTVPRIRRCTYKRQPSCLKYASFYTSLHVYSKCPMLQMISGVSRRTCMLLKYSFHRYVDYSISLYIHATHKVYRLLFQYYFECDMLQRLTTIFITWGRYTLLISNIQYPCMENDIAK